MTKAILTWIGKALLAGLFALALLCLFCAFYYNVPVHYTNESGATEYKWEAKRFYSKGTEGFALGRTNNDGFNNLRDYTPGERIDILLMGSSHMEGFNVAQDENAAAVLNTLFDGEKYTYNIGTAGHTLPYCVKHLDRALAVYAPCQYVILETGTLNYAPETLTAAVDGTLADIPSHTGGLLVMLQKLPFLRLLYTKYVKGGEAFGDVGGSDAAAISEPDYEAALSRFLEKIGRESLDHGVQAIVVYAPSVHPAADGSFYTEDAPGRRDLYARLCEENGLLFVDLTERFLAATEAEGVFPFGFSNTEPGNAHINRFGQRLFAEAVYELIREREG